MKLLFWNINNKDNADLALACMREMLMEGRISIKKVPD